MASAGFLVILLLCAVVASDAYTCNLNGRGGRWDAAARAMCIASCQVQNCATGYCQGTTCVCSRCSSGRGWGRKRRDVPLEQLEMLNAEEDA